MPTVPVREAVSAMPNTRAATTAASNARGHSCRSPSQTAAAAPQTSRVDSWLGWRMLPMARPAMVG